MRPFLLGLSAFVFDAVLVVVFAAIGRASHGEPTLQGLAFTAWPFLFGLCFGWLLTRGWRAPFAVVPTGLGVWFVTLVFGILTRAAIGEGIALSFMIVTAVVLGVFLVGWRLVGEVARRVAAAREE